MVREPIGPRDGELVIGVGLGQSSVLRVTDLGELLQSVAKDYRQINPKRELVVQELVQGSIWITLRDAVSATSGFDAVLKFGKTVFELLKAIRSDQNLSRIEHTGLRTIQSLAKTSARSGSTVQFEYRKSFMKEEIFFKIQPHETSKLQAKITEIKRHSRKHLAQGSVGLSSDLARLARSGEMTMLATIANVLVAKGQRGLVNEIANELDAEGHVEAAAILRDAADQVRRRPNPPLLR